MISKLLFILLILLGINSCFGQDKVFIDEILNNEHCQKCYFVAIDVGTKDFSGRVVIPYGELLDFVNKTEGFEDEQSKDFIKSLLVNNQSFIINDAKFDGSYINIDGISKKQFKVVDKSEKVDNVATKGCMAFINYFFLRNSLELSKYKGKNCYEFIKKQHDPLMLNNPEIKVFRNQFNN